MPVAEAVAALLLGVGAGQAAVGLERLAPRLRPRLHLPRRIETSRFMTETLQENNNIYKIISRRGGLKGPAPHLRPCLHQP